MDGVLAKPLRLDDLRRALAGEPAAANVEATDSAVDRPLLNNHRLLLGEQKVQGLLRVLHTSIIAHRTALAEAIAADDCTEVAHLAHRLAGSSDSLGLRGLAGVLRELEEAALANAEARVQSLASGVDEQMERALEVLEGLM